MRRIIAVEAKVNDISAGLQQAGLNRWFAHDSFLLLPKNTDSEDYSNRAEKMNVRLITGHESKALKPTVQRSMPISYASWLFNEWAWKASAFKESLS